MVISEKIYADNAATTPLALEALDAMLPFLKNDFANPSSLYSFSRPCKKALADARSVIAEYIGAKSDEIFFTSGGTESDNWALKSTPCARILYSAVEHHAVINSCWAQKSVGKKIKELPVNQYGQIETLLGVVRSGDLVSIMTANNELGSVNDIAKLANEAKEHGALFHTDAVQAVGHIPINVSEWNIDLLSASAHKFNGPKGIGFIYIRKGTTINSFIHGGQQEFNLRAGTENIASIVGMATALKLNVLEQNRQIQKLQRMEKIFKQTILSKIPSAIFNGALAHHLPGLISLSIHNTSAEGILHLLDLYGIFVSTGAACNSQSTQISHVLKAIGMPKDLALGTIRISFGKNNIESDAIQVANFIAAVYKKIKDR